MRQSKVSSDREVKYCSACGAKSWLKDANTGTFSGPWHFTDCPSISGGAELNVANIQDLENWTNESFVSKNMGLRILRAIYTLIDSPNHDIMLQRKAAIHEEIERMTK